MISLDKAEEIALKALGWIAQTDDLMQVFLGSTGASLADVKAQMADRDFLGSVLDFLMLDDAWVTRFCDENALDYRDPMLAQHRLSEGREA